MTKESDIPNHVVELTGTICSGKSSAGNVFREIGIKVEDADEISKDITLPGQPAFDDIVEAWPQVLGENGEIDRNKLRELTFGVSDEDAIRELQGITHPRIKEETIRRLSQATNSLFVVYERPALRVQRAIIPSHQLAIVRRLQPGRHESAVVRRGRSNGQAITYQQAAEMIARQYTTDELKDMADSYINNNKSRENLARKVKAWTEDYTEKLKMSTESADVV